MTISTTKVSQWKECIFWKNDQHYPTRETFDICILLSPQKRKVHVGARPAVKNAPGACADLHDAVTPAGIWVTTLTPVGLSLLNVSRPVHLLLYFRSCQTPRVFVILILGCSEDVIPRNDWRRKSSKWEQAVCGCTARLAKQRVQLTGPNDGNWIAIKIIC